MPCDITVTSCEPCSYFVYLCMLFQYISMFPYQKLRRVCGRASTLRWLGHGKLPSPQYLEISDRNRSTFWILLNPFGSFRILLDPLHCCGLLCWVDTGYIWILLMLTVQTTDPMKWYEMIWNACLMTRGKIVKKIVPKEILYSGGSWVLDVRFLVCLVAMSTVRFSCWSRWPWLGQGSRHLQWQSFQGGTPEGITTTSSWFPPSMWIAGALKPTPTSIPLPTAACSNFDRLRLRLRSHKHNGNNPLFCFIPVKSLAVSALGPTNAHGLGARNVQVKEGELSGLPGVFLVYDFSPFLMKQTEQARNPLCVAKPCGSFLLKNCPYQGWWSQYIPMPNGHMMSYGYPYNGFSCFSGRWMARGSHLPLNHLGSHLPLNEGGWSGFRGECDPSFRGECDPAFAWQAQ